tara:strand:+ start:14893 stop:16458 length:1566 start_codon:yes stop_codon:yes gene_type:complete
MRAIDFFDRGAALDPAHTCMVDESMGREFSYQEVRELTLRIANGLLEEGFEAGIHGAVYSPNNALGYTCTIAMFRAGMVSLAVNPRNSLEENAALMSDMDCQVLFYHSVFESHIAHIRKQAPGIRLFVCLDKPASEMPALEAWVERFSNQEIALDTGAETHALIQPTGGTTGRSKGVVHTNSSFGAMMNLLELSTPYEQPPIYLAVAPLTHAGGYVAYSILARGGTLVIQAAVEPQLLLAAIEKYRVTTLFLPPTVIYVLLAQPNVGSIDFSSLKHLMYGASPMAPAKLAEALMVFGPVMLQVFGQTECFFPVTNLSVQDHYLDGKVAPESRLRSCGRVTDQPGLQVAVMGDKGGFLPAGENGELVVQGPSVMKEYYKQPELTAETIVDGWLHTGDVGYMDEDGFVYLVDRKKDMIISGGFNVFSAEVEKAMLAHPAVQECAVIGVPDDKWGEAVKAAVELKPGAEATEPELIAFCKEQIGSVKAPKSVDIVAQLPRTAVGKLQKAKLRAQYWEGSERAVS